jgi:DNA translocase FtsK/SpoIIIE-like protein
MDEADSVLAGGDDGSHALWDFEEDGHRESVSDHDPERPAQEPVEALEVETLPPTPLTPREAEVLSPGGPRTPFEGDPLPPTPPNPTRRRPEEWRERGHAVVGGAQSAWRATLGRLNPVAWAVARIVWAHPWAWAVLAGLGCWLTPVTISHIALALVIAAILAMGPSAGSASRSKQLASLAAVGNYRKRRRRIQRRWVKMWTNAGLVRPALTPGADKRLPKLKAMKPHRDGVTAYVAGEEVAVGVDQVISAAAALTETVGALSLRVTKPTTGRDLLHRRTDLLAVTLKFQDPFPVRPIRLDELPAPSGPGRVVIGLDEEHRGLEKSLFLPSLIVGAPGAGKSTEVWTTLKALRTAGIPFRLRVFDPKGGLELGDLKEAAYHYESVVTRWPRFLETACAALEMRQKIMRERGLRKLEPSEEFPLDLMLVDELVTALAASRGQEARVRIFGQDMSARDGFVVYLSQIRASLGSCIALSQLGEKAVLGPARAMFPYVSCLRVGPTEKELVDILLGQGAHNAYPAHLLDPTDPNMAGRGWVRTKEGVILYRAAYMNDAERAAEAAEIAKTTQKYRARGQRDPEVISSPRPAKASGGGRSRRRGASPAPAKNTGGAHDDGAK